MLKPELIPVIDHPTLARDRTTNAIVDVNTEAYQQYLIQKQEKLGQKARFSQLEQRINNMETDLSDIKNLLTRLLEK